ncbi:MAG: Coenzyme F420 hydrogenase/dehydrogenase, beta subunit C-terminal domain [Ignavibacteria bacterium]|jgi:coenzyme F420-reducing hydrogenase beta subunit
MKNNISVIKDCYGCGVCAIVCPQKIIQIELNQNGFYEPKLFDLNNCLHCELCLSVCAYSHKELALNITDKIDGYAAWSNSEAIRYKSSSGGVGYELGKYHIQQGYKACGVRYNIEKQRVEHFLTDNEKDYQASIGSKYIQSYTIDAFSAFKKKEKYFITGTPCQIDSLRRYIRQKNVEANFVLVDFFCHGVPSMLMWKKYVQSIENKIGKITEFSWRNKQRGWHDSFAIKANGGKYISPLSKRDIFYQMFLSDSCLGKACYDKCKYKTTASSADIRIGDLWSKTYKNEDKGVSGLLAITEVGKQIVGSIKNEVVFIPENILVVTEGQMQKSPPRPILYGIYMRMLKSPSVSLKTEALMITKGKKVKYYLTLFAHPQLIISKLNKKTFHNEN